MMKKTTTKRTGTAGAGKTALALAFLLAAAGTVSAEDGLAVTGNLNTGVVIEKLDGQDATAHLEREGTPGRVRLNFKLTRDNVVAEWSMQATGLDGTRSGFKSGGDLFPEAKGTATFWDEQFALSIGRLGGQWGSGGAADVNTGDTMAHFTFKPAVLPGLSAGFSLPGVAASTYSVGQYFSEIALGAQFAQDKLVDLRLGVKLDSDYPAKEGAKFVWGVSPSILATFVPGLTVWVDGGISGLGVTDGVTTKTGFKVAYEQGNLSASLPLVFETFAETSWSTDYLPKTSFAVKPAASYKITPWLKPGIDVEFYMTSDNGNLDAFDNVLVAPYVEFDAGSGLKIVPRFALTYKGENGKASWNYDASKTPALQGAGKSATDIKFELRFDYSF